MSVFISAIWKYLLISAPYLLLGLLVAGFIKAFLSNEKVTKILGKSDFFTVVKAALIGVPLPLCSCSVIPTAITLRKNGASNGATSSFLIATPESGIDSMAMTYAMMDIPMTIIRPFAALITAVMAGSLQFFFNDFKTSEKEEVKNCCSKNKSNDFITNIKNAPKYAFIDLIDDMAVWFVIGILASALIDVSVPPDVFQNLSGVWGRFIVLGIGIPLYICASASTPIAAALILKGMSPGTALILLLVGPATNISNILVLQKYIGKKGILINILSIAIVSFTLSYVVDGLYDYYSWPLKFNLMEHNHSDQTSFFDKACAIILGALLIKGLYKELKGKLTK